MDKTKKQYQSPLLKKFGKVGEITQSASTSGAIEDGTPAHYTS